MDFRRVYVSDDPCDARVVCNRLLANGLSARTVGDSPPFPGMGSAGRAEVWTAVQDADRAERMLIDWKLKPDRAQSTSVRFQFGLLGLFVLLTFVAGLIGLGVDFETSRIFWIVATFLFWGIIAAALIRRAYARKRQRKTMRLS